MKKSKALVQELTDALENLIVRFPLDGFAGSIKDKECKCNQFLDQGECRHIAALQAFKKAKAALLMLCVLVLSACGGGSGGASSAASPAIGQPNLVAPIDGGSGGGQPGTTSLTYYRLSKTTAPVNGWSTKTVTTTGNCVTYSSKVYCWDDGAKTLAWVDFSGTHYGPYTYTFFGYDINGVNWGSCSGGCGTSLFAAPRFLSPTLAMNVGATPINTVFANGTAINVTCTESSGTLSCGDFSIDLNQGSL